MRNLLKLFILLTLCYQISAYAALSSAAFYYGAKPPFDLLRSYDAAIVSDSDEINPTDFNFAGSTLYAYVSVGEVEKEANYYSKVQKKWILGENTAWQAHVMDQASPEWRQFFMDHIIAPLWKKGYQGFFLDTLDSFNIVAKDDASKKAQISGIVSLINNIHTTYPNAKIILNRGFEVFPDVKDKVEAMAVESLFAGWDQNTKQYEPISEADRNILLNELKPVKEANIPIISIDYMPADKNNEAIAVAKKINALGIIPWVTDWQLKGMGTSNITPVKRKIFILYTDKSSDTIFDPPPFTLLSLPLEYMGFIPEFHNGELLLPQEFDDTSYAGVVVWTSPITPERRKQLYTWLVNRMQHHTPIAFFDTFGFDSTEQTLSTFGVKLQAPSSAKATLSVVSKDSNYIGYEIEPLPASRDYTSVRLMSGKSLLQLRDQAGMAQDPVALTPWGGYVLDPFIAVTLPDERALLIINPYRFLQSALRLPQVPAPDITTENGLRVMFAHIDGDGFGTKVEESENTYSASEMYEKILKKYKIPTTVSVIAGELSKNGLYPKQSGKFRQIARDIFANSWIEMASHSYSHPFDWLLARDFPKNTTYRLPLPNYTYDAKQEIQGSIDFINNELSPGNNKKVKIMLWSGNANPDGKTIGLTYGAGVTNLNGTNTFITNSFRSQTGINPYGIEVDGFFQVFSPAGNEEFYTNGWVKPYFGFKNVIETFKLTEKPKRLKPIDIYYHFYSASKKSSLDALNEVYQWALTQPVINIFTSDYANNVIDMRNASLAKTLDGWQIKTSGKVRELRLSKETKYPDLLKSDNIVGFNKANDDLYIHMGPGIKSTLIMQTEKPTVPYLVTANGQITQFSRNGSDIKFKLDGYVSLKWQLANMDRCELKNGSTLLKPDNVKDGVSTYSLLEKDSDELQIHCS